VAGRIRSVADLHTLLGAPDRTALWTSEFEDNARALAKIDGLHCEEWERCHIYYERWKPVYIMAHEFKDGVVRCSVAVSPSRKND